MSSTFIQNLLGSLDQLVMSINDKNLDVYNELHILTTTTCITSFFEEKTKLPGTVVGDTSNPCPPNINDPDRDYVLKYLISMLGPIENVEARAKTVFTALCLCVHNLLENAMQPLVQTVGGSQRFVNFKEEYSAALKQFKRIVRTESFLLFFLDKSKDRQSDFQQFASYIFIYVWRRFIRDIINENTENCSRIHDPHARYIFYTIPNQKLFKSWAVKRLAILLEFPLDITLALYPQIEAQMFNIGSHINHFQETLKDSTDKLHTSFTHHVDKLSKSIDAIQDKGLSEVQKLNTTLMNLEGGFNTLKDAAVSRGWSFIVSTIITFIALYRAPSTEMRVYIATIYTATLPVSLIDIAIKAMLSLASQLTQLSKKPEVSNHIQPHVGETHTAPIAIEENSIIAMWHVFVHMFTSVTPTESRIDALRLKAFKTYVDSIKYAKTFVEWIIEIIKFLLTDVYQFVTGHPYITDQTKKVVAAAEKWQKDFIDYFETKPLDSFVGVDEALAANNVQAAFDLNRRLMLIEQALLASGFNSKNWTGFFQLAASFRNIYQAAIKYNAGSASRIAPIAIWFLGPPNQGKSALMQWITRDIMASQNLKYTQHSIYDRHVGVKYWEGYTGQFATGFNDAFQYDNSEIRTTTALEWIYCNSHETYQLEMAFEGKGKTFFASHLTFLTTNSFTLPQNLDLEDRNAFLRRNDFVVHVAIDPEYQSKTDTGQPMIDSDPSSEIWKFVLLDSMTMKPLKRCNYAQLLGLIYQSYMERFKGEQSMTSYLVSTQKTGIRPRPVNFDELENVSGLESASMLQQQLMQKRREDFKRIVQRYPKHSQQEEEFLREAPVPASERTFVPLTPVEDHPLNEGKTEAQMFSVYQSIQKYFYPDPKSSVPNSASFPRDTPSSGKQEVLQPTVQPTISVVNATPLPTSTTTFAPIEAHSTSIPTVYTASFVYPEPHPLTKEIEAKIKAYPAETYEDMRERVLSLDTKTRARVILSVLGGVGIVASLALLYKYLYPTVSDPETIQPELKVYDPSNVKTVVTKVHGKRPRRYRQVPLSKIAPQSTDQVLDDILIHRYPKNICGLSAEITEIGETEVKHRTLGEQAFFVKDKYFITAKHLLQTVLNAECEFVVFDFGKNTQRVHISDITTYDDPDSDFTIGYINDKQFPQFPDITSHFIKDCDIPEIEGCDFTLAIRGRDGSISRNHIQNGHFVGEIRYDEPTPKGPLHFINVTTLVMPNAQTKRGHCGNMYFISNSSFSRKIVGPHIAGSGATGYCVPITQEDLEAVFVLNESFLHPKQTEPQMKEIKFSSSGEPKIELGSNIKTVGILEPSYAHRINANSPYEESCIYECVTPITTRPAFGKPYYNEEGVKTFPLTASLKKMDIPQHHFKGDRKLLHDIAVYMLDKTPTRIKPEVYTMHDAINGKRAYRYSIPIHMETSPGYPYSLEHHTLPGKLNYFTSLSQPDGSKIYAPTPPLLADYEALLSGYIGKKPRVPIYWTVSLKMDERRPIEDNKYRIPRVIYAPFLPLFLASRQFIEAYVENQKMSRDLLWCQLGINPNSSDWEVLYRRLTRFGPNTLNQDGDIKGFDMNLCPEPAEEINELREEWYRRSPTHTVQAELTRRGIFEDTRGFCKDDPGVNKVCANVVFKGKQGEDVSGNHITTPTNSDELALMCYYISRALYLESLAPHETPKPLTEFLDLIEVPCFGDDHIISAPPEFRFLSFTNIARAFMQYFELTWTPTSKKTTTDEYHTVEDVTFLKRSFRNRGKQCPLAKSVIHDMVNWITPGKISRQVATTDNCTQACREWFQYGKEEFEEFKKKYNYHLGQRGCLSVRITYEELFAQRFQMEYQPARGFSDPDAPLQTPLVWGIKPAPITIVQPEMDVSEAELQVAYSGTVLAIDTLLEKEKQFEEASHKKRKGGQVDGGKLGIRKQRFVRNSLAPAKQLLENMIKARTEIDYFDIEPQMMSNPHENYKNYLQEYCQKQKLALPVYVTTQVQKQAHPQTFISQVTVNARTWESDQVSLTVKGAEQSAAYVAYTALMIEKEKPDNTVVAALASLVSAQEDEINRLKKLLKTHKIEPQMSSTDMSERQTNTEPTETLRGLTTFSDLVGVPSSTEAIIPIYDVMNAEDPYPDQGLKTVVERMYPVDTITWSGSSAAETLIATYHQPSKLMTTSTNLQDKLKRFQYFRADTKVKFVLNGTPFHAGKLLIAFVPCLQKPTTDCNPLQDIYTSSGNNHYILSANTTVPVEFTIPFVGPFTWWNMANSYNTTALGLMGYIKVYVLAPLILQGASNTPTVPITVYMQFTNVKLAGLGLRNNVPLPITDNNNEEEKDFSVIEPQMSSVTADVEPRIRFEQPFEPLIPAKCTVPEKFCFGEHITSWTEYLHRYTNETGFTLTYSNPTMTTKNPNTYAHGDLHPFKRTLRNFLFRRGSVRAKIFFLDLGAATNGYYVKVRNYVSLPALTETDITDYDVSGAHFVGVGASRTVEFEIPYYQNLWMNDAFFNPSGPQYAIGQGSGFSVNCNYWLSAGDDFSLGWPLAPFQITSPGTLKNQKKPSQKRIEPQMESKSSEKKEAEARSEKGTIAKVALATSIVSNSFKVIPWLSVPANMISKIAKGVSDGAQVMGLNKPTSVESIKKFTNIGNTGMSHMMGLDGCQKLSADPQNEVTNDWQIYRSRKDYNLFDNYKLLPALVSNFSYDASSTAGTKILVMGVTPTFCHQTTTLGINSYALTPLANYASYFAYWRGGIKYHIEFSTSRYTTGRLRLTWLPDPTFVAAITNEQEGDTVSKVVDIIGDTSVSITLPYLQDRPYLQVISPYVANVAPITQWAGFNGQLVIQVINPLTIQNSINTAVCWVSIWMSGAEDFECFRPCALWTGYTDNCTADP